MSDRIELKEDRIPVEGISNSAEELVEMFGGSIQSEEASGLRFTLPSRRGVAAAGGVECSLSWVDDGSGEATVTLVAGREVAAPRMQHILLLVAGAVGAVLWLLWPFFPEMGAVSWIGGMIAFATYFITLRRSPGGIAAELLQRLAARQRAARVGGER